MTPHDNRLMTAHDNCLMNPHDNRLVTPRDNRLMTPQDNCLVMPHNNRLMTPHDHRLVSSPRILPASHRTPRESQALVKGPTSSNNSRTVHLPFVSVPLPVPFFIKKGKHLTCLSVLIKAPSISKGGLNQVYRGFESCRADA